MSQEHFGNIQPTLDLEEHDGANNAKRVNIVAGAAGQATVALVGNITITDAKQFIGLVTVGGIGTVTLADPKGYIGLVTVGGLGTVTLADPKGYIGLVTVGGIGTLTLSDPKGFIGLTTAVNAASAAFIGIVTVVGNASVALVDPKGFVGLVTVGGIGTVTLADPKGYIGLTTTTLGVSDRFIGLVTATTRNAGTTKSLVILPVGLGNNSLATVAVPTSQNKINVTQLILNSNITTAIAIKSGVTYLTGNASLAITLFPGGGFVLPGSPDSPSWVSLPAGALVVEKRDSGGTVANIAGHVIYFDE